MSDERKKAGVWPWVVSLLIGLPILYVGSFGPVCWLKARGAIPDGFIEPIYLPVMEGSTCAPDMIGRAFYWYVCLGFPDDGHVVLLFPKQDGGGAEGLILRREQPQTE